MASCAKNGPDVNCCSLLPALPSPLLHTPGLGLVCPSSQGRESRSGGLALLRTGRGCPTSLHQSPSYPLTQSHPTSAGLLLSCHPNRSDTGPHSLSGMGCREASTVYWNSFHLCPVASAPPSPPGGPDCHCGPGDPTVDMCGISCSPFPGPEVGPVGEGCVRMRVLGLLSCFQGFPAM